MLAYVITLNTSCSAQAYAQTHLTIHRCMHIPALMQNILYYQATFQLACTLKNHASWMRCIARITHPARANCKDYRYHIVSHRAARHSIKLNCIALHSRCESERTSPCRPVYCWAIARRFAVFFGRFNSCIKHCHWQRLIATILCFLICWRALSMLKHVHRKPLAAPAMVHQFTDTDVLSATSSAARRSVSSKHKTESTMKSDPYFPSQQK